MSGCARWCCALSDEALLASVGLDAPLRPMEARLVATLLRADGGVVPWPVLIEATWAEAHGGVAVLGDNAHRVTLCRARKGLADTGWCLDTLYYRGARLHRVSEPCADSFRAPRDRPPVGGPHHPHRRRTPAARSA